MRKPGSVTSVLTLNPGQIGMFFVPIGRRGKNAGKPAGSPWFWRMISCFNKKLSEVLPIALNHRRRSSICYDCRALTEANTKPLKHSKRTQWSGITADTMGTTAYFLKPAAAQILL